MLLIDKVFWSTFPKSAGMALSTHLTSLPGDKWTLQLTKFPWSEGGSARAPAMHSLCILFYFFKIWSFSRTSMRRQPIQNTKIYSLTNFCRNDPCCLTCWRANRVTSADGAWGQFLALFLATLIYLHICSAGRYVTLDVLRYRDSALFFTTRSALTVMETVL